jgi:hypothetical protein
VPTWFTRDHTGRPLSDLERAFVAQLSSLLEEVRPAQVDPRETALTAEGHDCLICLIPHRWLGGVSIVIWLTRDGAALDWAHVGALARSHDSLDAGVRVGDFPGRPTTREFRPVLACVREQLTRALLLRIVGAQAAVFVADARGELAMLGTIGAGEARSERFWRDVPTADTVVRLVDDAAPRLTEASGAAAWFIR